MDNVRFHARPYVCGHLGSRNPGLLQRLTSSGPSTSPVHDSQHGSLWASRSIAPYRFDDGLRAFSWGDAALGPDRLWTDLAEVEEAPGFVDTRDEIVLHAGALGMIDVYWVTIGGAAYFASRLEPLLALPERPLQVDWVTWASVWQTTVPPGDRSPFADVHRLPGGGVLRYRRRDRRLSQERREQRWVRDEPSVRNVQPGDVVDAVGSALRRHVAKPLALPLSGGFDSRLLAMIIARTGYDTEAWTTAPDDGRDDDLEMAGRVAAALGMRHGIVMPEPDDWSAYAGDVFRRLEFRTTHHHWIGPLATLLRQSGRVIVDGLGGDVLFNTPWVREALAAEKLTERRQRLFDRMSIREPPERLSVLADRAHPWIMDVARRSHNEMVRPLAGHRVEISLSFLHTRTARAIACSPLLLFGPEASISLPFVDPDVISLALEIAPEVKAHDTFYRAVLAEVNRDVAALPSTNDPDRPPPSKPQRAAQSSGTRWTREGLSYVGAIPGLLNPTLAETLQQAPEEFAVYQGRALSRAWMMRLALFGHWMNAYRDCLGPMEPPWASSTSAHATPLVTG